MFCSPSMLLTSQYLTYKTERATCIYSIIFLPFLQGRPPPGSIQLAPECWSLLLARSLHREGKVALGKGMLLSHSKWNIHCEIVNMTSALGYSLIEIFKNLQNLPSCYCKDKTDTSISVMSLGKILLCLCNYIHIMYAFVFIELGGKKEHPFSYVTLKV